MITFPSRKKKRDRKKEAAKLPSVTSAYISMARIFHGHTWLLRRLGNIVFIIASICQLNFLLLRISYIGEELTISVVAAKQSTEIGIVI